MLTKAQMKSLPKGEYSNTEIARRFPNHGLRHRQISLPVDKNGNVVYNPLLNPNKVALIAIMRLNKRQYAKFSK